MITPNAYFQVNRRHTVSALTGDYAPTNRWYGASQIHEAVKRPATLDTTWQLHYLHGGAFAVKGDAVIEVSRKSIVPDCLTEIPKPKQTPKYRD